ncbi:hypothetical protein ACQKL5_03800 [Peribacillus sp. NPDC097675]|uniref:hypothetical protein n=1 Tax=Peribacillus sp. NPDC097675 TaxID=3390618 RepID=UPI003D02953B
MQIQKIIQPLKHRGVRLFRDTMAEFSTGVTVITTKHEDKAHGMTENAFISVSP